MCSARFGLLGCRWHLLDLSVLSVLLLSVTFAGSAVAQVVAPPLFGPSLGKFSLCNSEKLIAAKQLTFAQRTCWYGSELISPWAAVRAGFSSGLGQWRNDPNGTGRDMDDYARRFTVYYAKRTARETGELIAGYFNNEDPRLHVSGQTAVGKRVQSALLSVLIVTGEEGSRPALGPIAGALGSTFAGVALYRNHTGVGYAFRGAGLSYGSYFGKALYHEFRPDISFFVNRMLRKTRD